MNKVTYYLISAVRGILVFMDYTLYAVEKAAKSIKKDKQHYRVWSENQSKHVFNK